MSSTKKKFALIADVKPGAVLVTDGGFDCIPEGAEREVKVDEDGALYIECDKGHHGLDGQEGYTPETEDQYVGLYPKKVAEAC